jgi:hypothetical protein
MRGYRVLTTAVAAVAAALLLAGGSALGYAPAAASTWVVSGGSAGGGVVNSIAVSGSTAYLGGTIRDSIGLYNLLAIDLHTGEHRTWFPKVANYVQVLRIAVSGDKVFVGGEFCSSIG